MATTFGESIVKTAAFGTILKNAGMDVEKAATGLKSATSLAMGDAGRMADWAELLGVSVDDLNAKIADDLYGTLIETGEAFGMITSETERFAAGTKIFGTEGFPMMAKLTGQTENWQKALDLCENSAGALNEEFTTMASTTAAKMGMISSTIGLIGVELGTWTMESTAFQGSLDMVYETLKAIADIDFTGPEGFVEDFKGFGTYLKDAFTGEDLDKYTPEGLLKAGDLLSEENWGSLREQGHYLGGEDYLNYVRGFKEGGGEISRALEEELEDVRIEEKELSKEE